MDASEYLTLNHIECLIQQSPSFYYLGFIVLFHLWICFFCIVYISLIMYVIISAWMWYAWINLFWRGCEGGIKTVWINKDACPDGDKSFDNLYDNLCQDRNWPIHILTSNVSDSYPIFDTCNFVNYFAIGIPTFFFCMGPFITFRFG